MWLCNLSQHVFLLTFSCNFEFTFIESCLYINSIFYDVDLHSFYQFCWLHYYCVLLLSDKVCRQFLKKSCIQWPLNDNNMYDICINWLKDLTCGSHFLPDSLLSYWGLPTSINFKTLFMKLATAKKTREQKWTLWTFQVAACCASHFWNICEPINV